MILHSRRRVNCGDFPPPFPPSVFSLPLTAERLCHLIVNLYRQSISSTQLRGPMPGRNQPKRPRFIAIVGGSGAGKTWLARRLTKLLGERATHLTLDDFYRDRSHLKPAACQKINFDHPKAIDWRELEKVIRKCIRGRKACLPRYNFATHCRVNRRAEFTPRPLVLVDGLWLLRRPALRRMFDCKIFLDCPADVRLERRLRRDCAERGRSPESVRRQFLRTVVPMHDRFVASQSRWADIVFNTPPTSREIQQLAKKLKTLLQET